MNLAKALYVFIPACSFILSHSLLYLYRVATFIISHFLERTSFPLPFCSYFLVSLFLSLSLHKQAFLSPYSSRELTLHIYHTSAQLFLLKEAYPDHFSYPPHHIRRLSINVIFSYEPCSLCHSTYLVCKQIPLVRLLDFYLYFKLCKFKTMPAFALYVFTQIQCPV